MISDLRELWKYRELLASLTVREIKVRYKQTVFGVLWAVIQPFFLMVVFTLVFSRFAGMPSDGIPYPLFSYSALLPWTFFASSLSFAIPSLVNNENLVTKLYFPREIFPISSVFAAMADFIVAAVIFFTMLLFYRRPLTFHAVYLVPLIGIQVIFTLSIALFMSAINIYFRDVRYALPLFIQLWMFLTPVIYPLSVVPEKIRPLYMLNPMALIAESYREILLKGHGPDLRYLTAAGALSLFFFLLSYGFFKKIEMTFADII